MKKTLSIFSQKLGDNPELGREWPVGDDARPYVGSHLISVADGAGGRGGRRCACVAEGLCNRERSFDIMTAGCFEGDPERYRAQYDENFVEMYEMGDAEYARSGGRHSAYFGSRLATIFLRAILEDEFPENELYERFLKLAGMEDRERAECLKELEERLAKKLSRMLRRAEKNGCLENVDGRALNGTNAMSTTYSGIVFYEEETCVHLLSIQVGDSMLWGIAPLEGGVAGQRRFALRQLQPVQETESGGISNYICTDAPFYLRCAWHRLEKPCGVLVASDGCFDAFPQLVQFEFRLMYELMKADDLSVAQASLTDFYDKYTHGDDSATMALRFFGVKDYSVISRMANRRQAELQKEFEPENDALYNLDEDAAGASQRAVYKVLRRFKEEFWNYSRKLRSDAVAVAERDYGQAIESTVKQAERALATPKKNLQDAQEEARKAVEGSWFALRRMRVPGADRDKIYEDQRALREAQQELMAYPGRIRSLLEDLAKHIMNNAAMEPFDEATRKRLDNLSEQIISDGDQLRDLLEEYEDRKDHVQEKERRLQREKSRRVGEEREAIARCVQEFSVNPGRIQALPGLTDDRCKVLSNAFKKISDCDKELQKAREGINAMREDWGRRVFDAKPESFLTAWREKYADELPEEFRRRVESELGEAERARDENMALVRRREELCERYKREMESMM